MASTKSMMYGEFVRTMDERYRVSLPNELADQLNELATLDKKKPEAAADCILVKEQAGCLSLWPKQHWAERMQVGLDLVEAKVRAGRLNDRFADLQQMGRLLSTRHREVQLAGRGRLVIPEGFREFLQVQPEGDLMIVGAAVCIELWHPAKWLEHLQGTLPQFQKLFDQLIG